MKFKIILPLLLLLIWHLPANADFLRIDEYKAALKVDPRDHIAHYGLGRAYRQMGLYEDAIKEFDEVLILEPLFPAA
ncbi:MAG: tetratricopeptide repeat protein, partial [Nitrospinota bacterium]|nr:tetratricopeptide repeat protein [Nitrospinota bacterium]